MTNETCHSLHQPFQEFLTCKPDNAEKKTITEWYVLVYKGISSTRDISSKAYDEDYRKRDDHVKNAILEVE